jgi:ankyrin repeat protein
MRAKFIYEYLELPPKSKEQILKDLALLPKEKLNKLLLDAAGEGSLNKVIYLLDAGADVEVKDNDGRTALMYASWNRRKDIIQLLKKYK